MCNYDYEPQEKDEKEVSKNYREQRGNLLDAVLNLELILKDTLAKVARYAIDNRFQLKEYEKLSIQDMIIILDKCHFEFKEDDTFIMETPRALYAKHKHKQQLETSFEDRDKNAEILNEVSHVKILLEESIKFSMIEEQEILANLLDGFDSLEKAFNNFAKI